MFFLLRVHANHSLNQGYFDILIVPAAGFFLCGKFFSGWIKCLD